MNIRLLGYFDKNFGDDLMQLILVDGMQEHEFFVKASQKEFLTHFRDRKNVHLYDDSVWIDAYVNVIGTGFKFDSKMNIITKFLSIPHEEKFPLEKTAVIDCSLDEPKSRAERFLVKRELNKYAYISCRDIISSSIASRFAKKSTRVFHDDIVFALEDEYIYPRTDEGCLGIIPIQKGFSKDNFDYYTALAKTCDWYADKNDKNVLIFAFDTGNENDTLAALSIQRLMRRGEKAEIIAYNGDPKYIFKNIARCDKIVSSRFHGVIAAALAGVPVAAVSDTSKIDILSHRTAFLKTSARKIEPEDIMELLDRTYIPTFVDKSVRADAKMHLKGLEKFLEEVSGNGKG